MFNFFGRVSDLTDPKRPLADVNVAWARLSEWLPWMKRRGRPRTTKGADFLRCINDLGCSRRRGSVHSEVPII